MVAVGDRITADQGNNFLSGISGTGSLTIPSGSNAVTGTISYGKTFTNAPYVLTGAASGANVTVNTSGTEGTTSFTARAFATSGNNVASATTVFFRWVAIGT